MKSVLVANRGEIAIRVIRACRDLGLRSIAVYAQGEQDEPHVQLADEAWPLGGASATDSYLSSSRILAIVRRAHADAVHPGYGFLSENAAFARAVQDAGAIWVGPAPEVITVLGDKVSARRFALSASVPLLPGTEDPVREAGEIEAFARAHGLPLVIKAAHGGGGRGMRVVREYEEIPAAFESAVREAHAAFGDGACFVERYLDRPRHVEAQLLADRHGEVRVIGTRDCSLQRRHQKLVEEAPAPGVGAAETQEIVAASERIAARVGYVGAGTVEFLLGENGELSFLEVNTRLQVEHPVTEETSGIDLVEAQLRIASGERLEDILIGLDQRGHALELRITAEDPALGFLPRAGVITAYREPGGPGVRVDSGIRLGSAVSGRFDALLAKLIVHGRDRDQAVRRARRALAEFMIEGVPTTIPFHRALLEEPDLTETFVAHTRWVEAEFLPRYSPAAQGGGDAEPLVDEVRLTLEIDGRRRSVGLGRDALDALMSRLTVSGTAVEASSAGSPDASKVHREPEDGSGSVTAPVEGVVTKILVAVGDAVAQGENVMMLEAMKMEHPVTSPVLGVVVEMHVAAGSSVAHGETLLTVEPAQA